LGLKNTELVRDVAASLSASPLPYSLRRDESDFAVFCFATPEDADGLPSASMGVRGGRSSGGYEQTTDAVASHAAERHRTD
jgi:hypothetical protein